MDSVELHRIRWHSRRGMLELDLMLNRFLEVRVPELSPELLTRYKELLAMDDPLLWDLLFQRIDPANDEERELLEMIRAC